MVACGSILAVIVGAIAVMVYHFYVPVPEGLEERFWFGFTFTIVNGLYRTGKYLEGLGVTTRYAVLTSGAPDTVDENIPVKSSDLTFDGVPVRMYRPKSAGDDVLPGVMFFHGGGWTIGTLDGYDATCRHLAVESNAVVVSVDYRMAPNFTFPIPVDDAYTATVHFLHSAKSYKVNSQKIAVMGDSAGGNLAAAVSLKARDKGVKPSLKTQVLIYPCLQVVDLRTPSHQQNEFAPILTRDFMVYFVHKYIFGNENQDYENIIESNMHTTPAVKKKFSETKLNHKLLPPEFLSSAAYKAPTLTEGDSKVWAAIKDQVLNPYFSPLMADDLKKLPEAYILTMEHDVLRDDGFFYTHWLKEAGVKVTHDHSKYGIHGLFMVHKGRQMNPELRLYFTSMVEFLKRKFSEP